MSVVVERILREWRDGTAFVSSISRMTEHPAFADIVRLGTSALPPLFADLAREPSVHVPLALHAITKATPVPKEHAGKVRLVAENWLRWGREHGHAPTPAGSPAP